jgi:hypothetical protein
MSRDIGLQPDLRPPHSSINLLYSIVSTSSLSLEYTLRQPTDNHHHRIIALLIGQRNSVNPPTSWVTTRDRVIIGGLGLVIEFIEHFNT